MNNESALCYGMLGLIVVLIIMAIRGDLGD